MVDIAHLGLAVDSREVIDASKDLDRIREAAAKAERQADSFGARVETAGKRAAAANDNAARSADRAAKAYDGYSKAAALAARAIGAVIGATVSTAFVRFADIWSDISSRVGIAVKNMDAAPAVLNRIAQTARMTYSNLELTAEGFVRNAMVLNELGKSTQQQLDYQEALNNALVVSGARGRAAEFVQESLNRSMALGAMRGIELNNVLNYGGRVAELLAEHFGTTTGGLMQMAREGRITGDVLFNVLTKNMEKLREEAESMPATIGDGMTLIRNALLQVVGGFDQALGASETFAAGLIVIADNMARIVTYAATAVTAFGTYYVGAMAVAYISTMTLTGALAFLRAALIRLGITAIVVAAGELVYQFSRLVSAAGGFGNAMGLLGDAAVEVVGRIGDVFSRLPAAIADVAIRMGERFADGIRYGINEALILVGDFVSRLNSIVGTNIGAPNLLGPVQINNPFAGAAAGLVSAATGPLESVDAIRRVMAEAAKETDGAANAAARFNAAMDQIGGAGGGSARQAADAIKQVEDAAESARQSLGQGFGSILDRLINRSISWKDALLEAGRALLQYLNQISAAQGGGGLFGGGIFGGLMKGLLGFAQGGVFQDGMVTAFAKGGVVTRPTVFPFAKGIGLMGEAGPEAIMPLKRGPDGRLGVSAPANQNAPQRVDVYVHSNDEKLRVFVRREADGRIEEAAPQIVGTAVSRSTRTVVPTMAAYQQRKAGGDYRG